MSAEPAADARLAGPPKKVRAALEELRELGHITEETVSTILTAGELSGQSDQLLSFAVAYLHLSSASVPIKDTIRMANEVGRRINLRWSAARWRDEHDWLARVLTLKRLTEDNVCYELSEYEGLMPASLKGYLIRSSRRLGMEGLRQRHCVASYHTAIQSGLYAIASVFVNRQRWTVQLCSTGNPDRPLRVLQVKTRFNGNPTVENLARIRTLFGDLGDPPREKGSTDRRKRCEDNLRHLLPVLRAQGIREVTVSFDGSGDSGCIEQAQFYPPIQAGTTMTVEVYELVVGWGENGWFHQVQPVRKSLEEAVNVVAEDYVEQVDVDWSNGDGGFGQLRIDVRAGTVSLEIEQRFTETLGAYSRTLDIETGEDL